MSKLADGYMAQLENVQVNGLLPRLLTLSKRDYFQHNYGSILKTLPKNPNVLEIGPGLGEFVLLLRDVRPNAVIDVIDNDNSIINNLKKKKIADNLYCETDLKRISSKLGQYHLIMLSQVLEHIKRDEYEKLFQVLDSHLVKGGKIVVLVPNCANPLNMIEQFGDLQHVTGFTPNSLRELVFFVGLSDSYTYQVVPYRIPPVNVIALIRILFQKIIHTMIMCTLLVNGGLYSSMLTSNIALILTKRELPAN